MVSLMFLASACAPMARALLRSGAALAPRSPLCAAAVTSRLSVRLLATTADAAAAVAAQGDAVRALKAAGAPNDEIAAAVGELLALKAAAEPAAAAAPAARPEEAGGSPPPPRVEVEAGAAGASSGYVMPSMDEIVSLCRKRGFVFGSSEIYNGFNGFYDYGPLGAELKRNIKNRWWRDMVNGRDDVCGLDSSIIGNPAIWDASGHVEGFSDPMVDDRVTKLRYLAGPEKGDFNVPSNRVFSDDMLR